MSNQYNILYPPSERLLFDGGKNNKYERSLIEENESPDCANVIFGNGAVETRGGSSKVNTVAVGSFVCDGLYTRRDQTTAETMCAFFNGTMYTLGTTTFTTVPSAQSVFTGGQRVAAAMYQNYLFAGNGGSIPYKWDGSNFTRHGVYEPTTTMSVASNGTGNLQGTYSWLTTYVNSAAAEGNISPAVTFTVTSTGGQVNLTSIPVAPQSFGVAARRIYRLNPGDTVYKRVTEIADNTTTTFTDNVASSAVGVTAPTDNGVPPRYGAILYHQNRLFVNDPTNPNYVRYTPVDEPFTFAELDLFKVGDATSDLVKGFEVYENNVLVLCENSEYLINMPDANDANWTLSRVRSAYGSKSPFGTARYKDLVMFPAMQNTKFVGFAADAGQTLDPTATNLSVSIAGSDLQSDRIEPDMFLVQPAFAGNISAIVYKNRIYMAVTYGSNQTTNNRVYVFDFSISNLTRSQKGAWVPYTGWNAAQFCIYAGNLYFGSSTATGFVYQAETSSYSDDGTAIDSYYWTKEYSGKKGQENLFKDFRKAKLLIEKVGAFYMSLTYRVDSDSGVGTNTQVDLNPGSTIWGTGMWGRDLWGGGTAQQEVTIPLGQSRGKRIQFRFSNQNTVNQRFKVHGLNFNYNTRGIR